MDGKADWPHAVDIRRAVVVVLTASLGAIAVLMPTAAQQARTEAQERNRLLELQRDAVTRLRQAARPGAPADVVRRALREASRSLEALGAGPDSGTANATARATTILD